MNNNANITDAPSMFCEGGINYNVLSFEAMTVEVTVTPKASGTIAIPSRVTNSGITYDVVGIGDGAFDRNKNITDVSLPDSVTYVGELAFCGVSSKSAIKLPKSLESIGRSAFNSKGLTFANLDLPSGLKEIKLWAFAGATIATKKVRIPASVCSMEYAMFQQCDIESFEVGEGNAHYKSIDGVLFSQNGDTLIEYPAESPRKTYEVPKGVKIINKRAFFCCKNVERIILPNTVSNISMDAFYSNPSLAFLEIRATTPPTLETSALRGLGSKCVVYVPKGFAARYKATAGWKELASRIVEEGSPQPVGGNSPAHPTPPIGENKPEHPSSFVCNGLNYKVLSVEDKTVEVDKNPYASGAIAIPSQVSCYGITFRVVGIGAKAFFNNNRVTDVSLPDTIKYVGDDAFVSVSSKRAIVLPKSLEKIGESAFAGNFFSFNNLDLPSSLKEIRHWAFVDARVHTKTVKIPASVCSLEYGIFQNSDVELFEVDGGNAHYKAIDGVLFSKNGDALIEYPHMIQRNMYLVPAGVKTIIPQAFCQCVYLQKLTLPSTVSTIGFQAFADCLNLSLLEIKATTPPALDHDAFYRTTCVVQVPVGCASKYRAAAGWKEIANRIQEEPYEPDYRVHLV